MARKDNCTMELPGITRARGRPRVQNPKTGAERQAAYRKRLKAAQNASAIFVTGDENLQITEICDVCFGEGVLPDVFGDYSGCFNCCGSGKLKYQKPATPERTNVVQNDGFSTCSASTTASNSHLWD